jgi:hypothetical protein
VTFRSLHQLEAQQSMPKRRLQRDRTRFERLAASDVPLKTPASATSEQGR